MSETTLNPRWLTKMTIFLVFLVGLGAWGLYDAVKKYPDMGREYAEYAEWAYLTAADEAGSLLTVSTPDPAAELARLRAAQDEIMESMGIAESQGRTLQVAERRAELRKLAWLTALSRVGDLTPENTTITDPRARLNELASWSTKDPPKQLAVYDLPLQWVFVVVGFGGGLWLAFTLFKASRVKFRYDPAERRLVLPDGREVTPEQIEEVDKRKWDKFFVSLRLKDGTAVNRLDLLRYRNLEEWILEMEKHTDGYEPPDDEEGAKAESEESETAAAGASGASDAAR